MTQVHAEYESGHWVPAPFGGAGPVVRTRVEADMPACERLARAVRRADGYPVFLPNGDVRAFLSAPDALGAWVAVSHDEIVGHVALHETTSRAAMVLARKRIGVPAAALGVIARLMVAPPARREGVAQALLDVAVAEARRRELVPILDVVTRHEPAIALYERAGWNRIGEVSLCLPNGDEIEEIVYRAPAERASAAR